MEDAKSNVSMRHAALGHSYRVAQLVWRQVIEATELGHHKPCGKIRLSFGAGFRAMRMLGREAIIVRSICYAKSRTFMAIVGRSSRHHPFDAARAV
jgi:hypothetical protein